MKKLFLIAAVSLFALSAPSMAEDAKKPVKAPAGLGPVDVNKDGAVTKEESDSEALAQFKMFDANGDQKVTKEEYTSGIYKINKAPPADDKKAAVDKSISMRFALHDTNKDGVVSKDEFLGAATKRHKTMDLNGDGKVTQTELDELKTKVKARIEKLRNEAAKKAKDGQVKASPDAPPAQPKQ